MLGLDAWVDAGQFLPVCLCLLLSLSCLALARVAFIPGQPRQKRPQPCLINPAHSAAPPTQGDSSPGGPEGRRPNQALSQAGTASRASAELPAPPGARRGGQSAPNPWAEQEGRRLPKTLVRLLPTGRKEVGKGGTKSHHVGQGALDAPGCDR